MDQVGTKQADDGLGIWPGDHEKLEPRLIASQSSGLGELADGFKF